MSWTAIVPLKVGSARKTRLAPRLDEAARAALADRMAAHVLAVLCAAPAVGEVRLLSREPPVNPGIGWERDGGEGLNEELIRSCSSLGRRLLLIHGDLPLLTPGDVTALLAAADTYRAAIAPDRHDQGTNALALADPANCAAIAFGPGSFARHCAALAPAVIRRPGLAIDIDEPDDLDLALRLGLAL